MRTIIVISVVLLVLGGGPACAQDLGLVLVSAPLNNEGGLNSNRFACNVTNAFEDATANLTVELIDESGLTIAHSEFLLAPRGAGQLLSYDNTVAYCKITVRSIRRSGRGNGGGLGDLGTPGWLGLRGTHTIEQYMAQGLDFGYVTISATGVSATAL